MASFLRRQDDLQTLKTRNLYLQKTDGTYPADQSVLTISGSRGLVTTSAGITVQSLSTCALTASQGRFNVSCPTGWVDMYPPGLTSGSVFGTYASTGIQLHGGITSSSGTTANMYIFRNYIQAEPGDLSGAGVPTSSTMGVIGIADPNNDFRAPVLLFDGSANKMRVVQFFAPGGNRASVTIDNNYELEPLPLNQSQHVGRVNAQQIQVAGYMGVNVYDNSGGFLPIQPIGITSQFGGACLRNSPTSNAFPYNSAANANRYPTIVTAWKPTAGTTSLNYNILTMDASNGFIGIRNNTPAYTFDVSGNINASGNVTAAGAKPFNIIHPLSDSKRLVFCAIEGPRCDLIYRGRVALTNGTTTVHLDTQSTADGTNGMTPGTFSALARNPQVYLQNNDTFDAVKGTVQGGTLTIRSANPDATATIDWMVMAERKDAAMYGNSLTDSNGYLMNEHPAA